jgi:hypothetical protein
MGDLSLTVTLESLLVRLLSESEGIEKTHGRKSSREVCGRERVQGRRRNTAGSRCECNGRANESREEGELHHWRKIRGLFDRQ